MNSCVAAVRCSREGGGAIGSLRGFLDLDTEGFLVSNLGSERVGCSRACNKAHLRNDSWQWVEGPAILFFLSVFGFV